MSAIESGILSAVAQVGFPVAVALYLLYERTQTFKQATEEARVDRAVMLEVIKANTTAQTELRGTIQKLCEIVNGNKEVHLI